MDLERFSRLQSCQNGVGCGGWLHLRVDLDGHVVLLVRLDLLALADLLLRRARLLKNESVIQNNYEAALLFLECVLVVLNITVYWSTPRRFRGHEQAPIVSKNLGKVENVSTLIDSQHRSTKESAPGSPRW